MRFYPLPFIQGQQAFQLSGISGNLIAFDLSLFLESDLTYKVQLALDLIENPYRIRNANYSEDSVQHIFECAKQKKIIDRLMWLSNKNFLLARFYASRQATLHKNASDAIKYFRQNVSGDQQKLCLPRALYAAKTSRQFAEKGVLFIGVFLPACSMHAWIIEDGELTDPSDQIWTNYRPVGCIG